MSATHFNTWQDVRSEVLNRIHSRTWKPGNLIPNEADLAKEFGCARATVNRALRAVAEAGLLERKRKAGTRVAKTPVRKATLSIPIIRQEIENANQTYSYALISAKTVSPPTKIQARMKLAASASALKITALHLADGQAYMHEERWINIDAIPDILSVDLSVENANEWLVTHAPFTNGDIAFSAIQANTTIARKMGVNLNEALFMLDRTTWNEQVAITTVRMIFHANYQMQTTI